MIRFVDLTKRFGQLLALDHVNFEIESGEVFGIAGPNGAGKTTLVRILCTALRPDEGTIYIDGLDISKHELEVKRRIGYLPEEPNLYERLTPKGLLDFFGRMYSVENREDKIERALEMVGLSDRGSQKISTFSKGMRHRLSFARALLHDPGILVLDEPTMGLDPSVALSIRNLIKAMKGDKTVVLCTHYMEEAELLCDRMAVLNKGQVAAIGTPDELKKHASEEQGTELSLDEAFVYYAG